MPAVAGKNVFITGASAGIGEACARVFAREGARLLLTARRNERLAKLAAELKFDGVDVHWFELDVRKQKAVQAAIDGLPEAWRNIDILINNAGLSRGLDKLQDGKLDDWEEMIDTNVKGLLYVSRAVLPGMVERKSGHVINIGSIAGYEVYPMGNVYCATKHAVRALNKGMRIDTLGTGVRVTSIDPGLVETEFSYVRFRGDDKRAKTAYTGIQPLVGEDVAETVLFAATRPPHVNINALVVMPTAQAGVAHIFRE
ncbi:MAG: SDR family oxidoreductase [bacterium]|nr:SDR family oxidoreductase [bacterium]